MNLTEPTLSRRMAQVVQTMDLRTQGLFIQAVRLASSEDQILEPYRTYLREGYKPDTVLPSPQGETNG